MPDYRSSRFPRKPFPHRGGFGGAPKHLFKAECSSCGKACEVPFRPNGKKPVYCKECFAKHEPSDRAPRREFAARPPFSQPPRDDRSMQEVKAELHGINEKLERLIALMTPPVKTKKVATRAKAKTAKRSK